MLLHCNAALIREPTQGVLAFRLPDWKNTAYIGMPVRMLLACCLSCCIGVRCLPLWLLLPLSPVRCVVSYPQETREVLDSLYALWFDHLWDNIPTVRENSAAALANAVRAYGEEATTKVVAVLRCAKAAGWTWGFCGMCTVGLAAGAECLPCCDIGVLARRYSLCQLRWHSSSCTLLPYSR